MLTFTGHLTEPLRPDGVHIKCFSVFCLWRFCVVMNVTLLSLTSLWQWYCMTPCPRCDCSSDVNPHHSVFKPSSLGSALRRGSNAFPLLSPDR